jgi:hypothetical protein
MRRLFAWTLIVLATGTGASAQDRLPKWEVSGGYTYLRANIVPSCACFNTHGGTGSAAFHANNWLGLVGEFSGVHSGDVQSSGRDLTVFTYQFGPRISMGRGRRATPFAHALFGGGRASGSLYDVPIHGRSGTGPDNSWAVTLGGGLDVKAGSRVSIRVFQVDWMHTRFHNGDNNQQNNLRVSTGIVFRF